MNNRELQKYIETEDITVVEAMKKIDWNSCGILYITDKSGKLTGSLTDGDIRRWIIKTGDKSSWTISEKSKLRWVSTDI